MGKPLAGQLGQMGSQTQSQRGGGFGGQQSLSLQKPMQPQMPQQNLGGGMQLPGMGAFQDFMRQQQMGQQYQNSRPDLTGGPMGAPQQPTYGGFGNGIGINIAQPPQSGTQAMPQQDMLNAQQLGQAFAQMQQQMPQMPMSQMPMSQMPQMPMAGPGGGNRDFYDRQVSPEQRARNEAGMADGSYAAYYQQATGQPLPQQQMPLAQPMNQPLGSMQDRTNRLLARGLAEYRKMPQQVRPEPPRMQAMRGIQQLASRQRGYNR